MGGYSVEGYSVGGYSVAGYTLGGYIGNLQELGEPISDLRNRILAVGGYSVSALPISDLRTQVLARAPRLGRLQCGRLQCGRLQCLWTTDFGAEHSDTS